MKLFFKNLFAAKGTLPWAIKQMRDGHIVKPENITGAVIFRLDSKTNELVQWAFTRETPVPDELWKPAFVFLKDLQLSWRIWDGG